MPGTVFGRTSNFIPTGMTFHLNPYGLCHGPSSTNYNALTSQISPSSILHRFFRPNLGKHPCNGESSSIPAPAHRERSCDYRTQNQPQQQTYCLFFGIPIPRRPRDHLLSLPKQSSLLARAQRSPPSSAITAHYFSFFLPQVASDGYPSSTHRQRAGSHPAQVAAILLIFPHFIAHSSSTTTPPIPFRFPLSYRPAIDSSTTPILTTVHPGLETFMPIFHHLAPSQHL